jgi:L-aspartate oxidase
VRGRRGDDELDVLVIGSGIAGLSTAIALAGRRRVAVISKESGGGGSTVLAQGGIAAAIGQGDSTAAHALDTVLAAAGLGDPEVAEVVTSGAPEAVSTLIRLGAHFDEGALGREGGHGVARVAHARGDATGAEITRALMEAARARGVPVADGLFLVDLLTCPDQSRVIGAVVWDSRAGALRQIYAGTVVLATGGYGQLWACTTSPRACSGDGLAAALRAGAQVADLEFVQFHPSGMDLGRDPRPLASEALRGAGARLRDSAGEYLFGPDGAGDLAPRDVVSRAMAQRMAELGTDHCYLDATMLGEDVEEHFPTFVAACRAAGTDPERDWAPVSPTAHYTMGGVLTDTEGRTTLEGLMAVGEVGCNGLHGANRLASNSLLEGAVVGRRAALAIVASRGPVAPRPLVGTDELLQVTARGPSAVRAVDRRTLRVAMQADAGVARDEGGLGRLANYLAHAGAGLHPGHGGETVELANMLLVARAVVGLAARRTESRGAHWRTDYPVPRPEWRVRQAAQLTATGEMAVGTFAVEGLYEPAVGQAAAAV